MKLSELDYTYPEELVALKPHRPSRILLAGQKPQEISKQDLWQFFQAGDCLVLNETKVIKRKVPAKASNGKDLEVLFINQIDDRKWQVLMPTKKLAADQVIEFQDGSKANLIQKDLPQTIELQQKINDNFFEQNGKMPLPPYISKLRNNEEDYQDDQWYQTAWAKEAGSAAAPTASLHFNQEDLESLINRGVHIVKVCLHVGMGTFQPIKSEDIRGHQLHYEEVKIPKTSLEQILKSKKEEKQIWAMGTTVCRSLESYARNMLKVDEKENFYGKTNLYIKPGDNFLLVDNLLTNFHQPKTSLLALVAAFCDIETVKKNYQWAIDKKFRLFSYGDLSVWRKQDR